MENKNIPALRLLNHQLSGTELTTPCQIVAHFGIMQAQDFNSATWAIGARLAGCTEKQILETFDQGEILRTHVLRPTWHFVTPENIRWMLQLSAKRIMQSMKSRDLELGLTEEIYTKCYRIIEKAFEKEDHITREGIQQILQDTGMKLDSSQMYHVLTSAEANGILCSGAMSGKNQTYSLLEKRVPATKPLTKEESLAKLARIYFTGHGPATLHDFVWWSGLSVGEARQGLEAVQSEFVSETVDGQKYWMPVRHCGLAYTLRSTHDPQPRRARRSQSPNNQCRFWEEVPRQARNDALLGRSCELHLLPAFDEYIVGYKDRTAVLTSENHQKAISSNGVFRPVVVQDGKVIGLWKKATSGKKIITLAPFEPIDQSTQKLIDAAADKLQAFYR